VRNVLYVAGVSVWAGGGGGKKREFGPSHDMLVDEIASLSVGDDIPNPITCYEKKQIANKQIETERDRERDRE
jgi:hypothetical protein